MEISLEQYNAMAERLTYLEQKLAEREWIPVSERLPLVQDGDVLATTTGLNGAMMQFNKRTG